MFHITCIGDDGRQTTELTKDELTSFKIFDEDFTWVGNVTRF